MKLLLLFLILIGPVGPAFGQYYSSNGGGVPLPVSVANGGTGVVSINTCGSSTQALSWTGTAFGCQTIAAGSPAGSNTQVQYNNSSSFGGASGLTIDANGNPAIADTNGAHTVFLVNTSTMSIKNGWVGIGTASPANILDVRSSLADGSVAFNVTNSGTNQIGGQVTGNATGFKGISAGGGFGLWGEAQTSGTGLNVMWGTSSGSGGRLIYGRPYGAAATSQIQLESYGQNFTGTGINAFHVMNLGIGGGTISGDFIWITTNTAAIPQFSVLNGGIIQQANQKSCATGITTDATGKMNGCVASDRRLKINIQNLKLDLSIVDKLHPVTYEWQDKSIRGNGQKTGFIAQEVERVLPNAVVSAGQDFKGIDPMAINALLVAEIQDLRKRVAALESR